jgi:tetratricopeptide (TPR) repeat protein
MSNVPLLVGVSGKLQGHQYNIPPQGLRIGRQAGNEVLLDETGVSRQHARLIFHNGALWVQDMGSRNGIFVNDARVQAHRQLSPGDTIRIGNTAFEVHLEGAAADHSVSVVAPRAPGARSGFKLWPFAVAAVIVIGLIILVALAGRGRVKVADPKADDEVVSLLASTMESVGEQAAEQPQPAEAPVDASLSLLLEGEKQAPAPTFGTASDIQDEWPEPPPGMSSRELVEKAHGLYNAGRLHDALVAYHQAQMLDAACEICVRRIDRLSAEISEKISENFDAGLRYYDDMQFQQAITSWEMVLLLAPNPESRSHQQAKTYLAKAQAQMSRQY